MTAYGSECFTMNEVNRLKILQDVIDGRLTTLLASQRPGLTDRHCRRLLARYRESGPLALANRRRGLRGNRQLLPGLAELALGIIRDNYADFSPTLACEKLAELHDVVLAKETVRQLMVRAGLWIPRKMRAPRIQQPRYRRACVGELIQLDGCYHRWFEERGPACTQLVYVDDATSRLMQLDFVKSESTLTPRSGVIVNTARRRLYQSVAGVPATTAFPKILEKHLSTGKSNSFKSNKDLSLIHI